MRQAVMALILAAVVVAAGCGEKTGGGTSASGGTGPRITGFKIGSAVNSHNVVTLETDAIQPGDTVNVSFEVKNLPSRAQVKAVWSDSSKKKISEEQKEPSGGAVGFQMKDSKDLAAGEYLVELFYSDAGEKPEKWTFLGTKGFRIGAKRPS